MSSFARRGRPPSSSLEQRILEGMASTSELKCHLCHRVFPRPKSLRAHMNCHTGQTPYVCDYPGCDKAFRQSGHLRSHTFRHTGEKPFRCPTDDCGERFVHANRHCSVHDPLKIFKLIRDGNEFIDVKEDNLSEEQQQWLQRYRNKKYNFRGTKRSAENDSDEENIPVNNKRTCNDGYNSAGSESPSSSPIYKNDECSFSVSESSSSSTLCEYDESVIAAALSLMQLKNKSFS